MHSLLRVVVGLLSLHVANACLFLSPNPNPPPNAICEENGTLKTPKILSMYRGLTPTACYSHCLRMKTCKGISLSGVEDQKCTLYKASFQAMGFSKKTETRTNYVSKGCYICDRKTCTASGEELVKNGNFNAPDITPWIYQASSEAGNYTFTTGEDGTQAFEVTLSQNQDDQPFAELTQYIQLCKGPSFQYQLSFQYRFTNGLSDATIYAYAAGFEEVVSGDPTLPNVWQNYTSSPFKETNHFEVNFEFQNLDTAQSETFSLDNVFLETVKAK